MTGTQATPAVMGRAAVLTTCCFIGAVGLAQVLGFKVSGAIDDTPDHLLQTVWGVSFVLAAALVIIARNHHDVFLAMCFELAGLVCAVCGLSVYVVSIFVSADGWPASGTMALALGMAASVNLIGRGWHVLKALFRWLIIFRHEGRGARFAMTCMLAVGYLHGRRRVK